MKHLIFVYGTLKTRKSRNNILSNSEYLGIFKSLPKYTMVNLGSFPGIFEGGNTSISGEIYRVSEEVLHQLDLIEGHPIFILGRKFLFMIKKMYLHIFLKKKSINFILQLIQEFGRGK